MNRFAKERLRALEYRRMMQARADHARASNPAYAGNAEAAATVKREQAALRRWPGWDPVERK